MTNVTITNDTANSLHIGPVTIFPGQSREVPSCYLGAQAPAPESTELSLDDWLTQFVEQTQKDMAAQLPEVDDAQLYAVCTWVSALDNEPKTLMKAIDEQTQARGEGFALYGFREELKGASVDELQTLLLECASDDQRLQAVQAELAARDISTANTHAPEV